MQNTIRKLAAEYRACHPYTQKELEDIALYCQEQSDSEKAEQYMVTLYWYYVTDIYSILTKYHVPSDSFYDEEDLAAEAVVSLFDAVRTFKSGGASLRTYISRVAERAIATHIKKNSNKVKITADFAKKLHDYKKYCEQYEIIHGIAPKKETIKEDLKLGNKELELLEFYKSCRFCSDTSEEADLTEIPDEKDPFENDVIKTEIIKAVRTVIETCLDKEEKEIICLRNGIGGKFHSVHETALILGIKEEEILKKEILIREKLKENNGFQELAKQLNED